MNNQLHQVKTWPKGWLLVLLAMAMLFGGCATEQSRHARMLPETPAPSVKALSEADAASYQSALEELDQRPDHARQLFSTLAQAYPGNVEIRTNLALAHYRCGDYEQALKTSDEAIRLNPAIAENYNLRGLIALERNNFQEAENAFLMALEKNPELALAHYNLALLYDVYFQNIARALNHYKHYLAAYPDDNNTVIWVEQLERSLEKK